MRRWFSRTKMRRDERAGLTHAQAHTKDMAAGRDLLRSIWWRNLFWTQPVHGFSSSCEQVSDARRVSGIRGRRVL